MKNIITSLLKNYEVFIFGAGKRGKEIYSVLSKSNINILGFIDNDEAKHGTLLFGKPCLGLRETFERNPGAMIVISPMNNEAIVNQLKSLNVKYILGQDILDLHWFTPYSTYDADWAGVRPFNWYESPYPDLMEIHAKEAEIFDTKKKILEIDFNDERQLDILEQMKGISLIPWSENKSDDYRYYYKNMTFCKGSADVLYYMLRILKPKRIIEVGSGFSTAIMLDTNNAYFDNTVNIHAIEPYTERLRSLLRKSDNLEIHECTLQQIPVSFFEQLEENDILFIDSSHVSRIDSDVNYYLFEILPRLKKGVYIHFHDMFYPFIYPKNWVYAGSAYNEMYLLRAFLMNNSCYSIQFFGEMIMHRYPEKLTEKLKDISGSLWIRKDYSTSR